MKERVQKLMAQANLGSRRACEALIEQRRVRVNGAIIALGAQADPAVDVIEVDGVRLKFEQQRKVYFAVNKPRNVLSTDKPHPGDTRRIVRDLVMYEGHLFTIGRLDAESEGLMVLTNDGDMANRLSHPRYRHTKTYLVSVYGLPPADALDRWRAGGIALEDEMVSAPCYIRVAKGNRDVSQLIIVMTEGKKRQIRQIASLLGYPVKRLLRVQIGQLRLDMLKSGEARQLTPAEVKLLATPAPELKEIRGASDKKDRRSRSGSADAAPQRERSERPGRESRPAQDGERSKPDARGSKRPSGRGRSKPRPASSGKPRSPRRRSND